jgi:two-component system nitrogen regulation response regulator GlnG
MQLGALDYLVKPLNVAEVRKVVARAVEVRRMASSPVTMDPISSELTKGDVIIGRSPPMQEVYKAIGLVASQNVTVLIRGESGTGKELVARALYQFSKRADGPFLAVNCAAIPESLLESELFGHEKGSFTGADKRRIGKFEQCSGGTLFLDEIGDMPPLLQSKLLRVLQDQQFQRVGSNETITADVRVLTATNRDLEKMVSDGKFREDLYYRLNGYTISLPPLRDRGKDLDLLVEHFLRQANQDLGKNVRGVAPDALDILRRYSWPGNVRELQNVIRQAVLQTTGSVLLADFLPDNILRAVGESDGSETQSSYDAVDQLIHNKLRSKSPNLYDDVVGNVEQRLVSAVLRDTEGDTDAALQRLGVPSRVIRSSGARQALHLPADGNDAGQTIAEMEKEAIRQALDQTGGHRNEAAQQLGISVRTLQRKIKEYGLQ